jgi:NRAMP (natural resistance-associated macrophage protein)-like metal ion transporter
MYARLKRYWKLLGPGLVTGAADDDPSGIATYSQTGAMFGYSQMWVALFSYPFMTAVQEMCGRIGLVTGDGLSGVIRRRFSRKTLWMAVSVLVIANTINIGADLGAMASAVQLIVPFPFLPVLVAIAFGTLVLQILVPYPTYAKFLKFLALSLFAYIAVAFLVKVDWYVVLYSTFVPHIELSKAYIFNIAAFLGTTISPYLFFWQADEEVEEEIIEGKISDMGQGTPRVEVSDLRRMRTDTVIGMFLSNLVAFFILVTVASTLGAVGITHIETAAQAAEALRPLAGDYAFILFAVGIIGTGLLAIPILAGSAGYAVAEAFQWKAGLGKRFGQAEGFYLVIGLATVVGLLVSLSPIAPMTMLYYAAMLNGVLAPPLLILILIISNDKTIMGEHTNGVASNVVGWTITGIMTLVGFAAIVSLFV